MSKVHIKTIHGLGQHARNITVQTSERQTVNRYENGNENRGVLENSQKTLNCNEKVLILIGILLILNN